MDDFHQSITPVEFEKLVKNLLEVKLTKGFKAFHNKNYKGAKSDHEHQIDFSMEGKIAGSAILIIGECKQYSLPVGLEKVMAFAYRIWDINAQKGIMVSSNGFQKGAYKIAKSAAISLVICRNKKISFELSRNPPRQSTSFFFRGLVEYTPVLDYGLLVSDDECIYFPTTTLLYETIFHNSD